MKTFEVFLPAQQLIDDGYQPQVGDAFYDGQHPSLKFPRFLAELPTESNQFGPNFLSLRNPQYQDPAYREQALARGYKQHRTVVLVTDVITKLEAALNQNACPAAIEELIFELKADQKL